MTSVSTGRGPSADTEAELLALLGDDLVELGAAPSVVQSRMQNGTPVLDRLDLITPERVTWLWPGRIAAAKVSELVGDPGLGKSTLLLDIAARVSRGVAMPD